MTSNESGRPVRITSVSFSCRPLGAIVDIVDAEGARGVDLIALPGSNVGQRRQHRSPALVLLGEPDLIAPDMTRTQEVGVMCGNDELCASWVCLLRGE